MRTKVLLSSFVLCFLLLALVAYCYLYALPHFRIDFTINTQPAPYNNQATDEVISEATLQLDEIVKEETRNMDRITEDGGDAPSVQLRTSAAIGSILGTHHTVPKLQLISLTHDDNISNESIFEELDIREQMLVREISELDSTLDGLHDVDDEDDNYVRHNEHQSHELEEHMDLTKLSNPVHDVEFDGETRKVLEFAYMRGGSSLVGQIFNHLSHSIYWYEPLDSFYTSYAGLAHWTIPYDITHTSRGEGRRIPPEECDAIGIFLSNMLNCEIDKLPVELLTLSTDTVMKMSWYKDYKSCVQIHGATDAYSCSASVSRFYCSNLNMGAFTQHCPDRIKTALVTTAIPGTTENLFKNRQLCLNSIKKKIDQCTPRLKRKCSDARIRSAKILRTRMSSMVYVMKHDPSVYILHIVRDPRGTMLSRRGVSLLAKNVGQNMSKEGVALCKQMMEDIRERKRLEALYPNRFLQIRYEDLATNLNGTLHALLDHLNLPYSKSLADDMFRMMYSGQKTNAGGFSQMRGNATQVAYAWRSKIDPVLKRNMDAGCQDLYAELHYKV